jgi:hypothetical protein
MYQLQFVQSSFSIISVNFQLCIKAFLALSTQGPFPRRLAHAPQDILYITTRLCVGDAEIPKLIQFVLDALIYVIRAPSYDVGKEVGHTNSNYGISAADFKGCVYKVITLKF